MPIPILAQVTLPAATGIVADEVVNDFAFNLPDAVSYASLEAALVDFYNGGTDVMSHNSIAFWLGPHITRAANACTIRVFNLVGHLDGSPHGSPVNTSQFTLGGADGGEGLPPQACVALSLHADLTGVGESGPVVAGVPTDEEGQDEGAPATHSGRIKGRARRRGRIFLGPLSITSVSDTAGAIRPTLNLRVDFNRAGARLLAAAVGWGVWSRMNTAITPIVGGSVADSYDVIRRRKLRPTVRSVFP